MWALTDKMLKSYCIHVAINAYKLHFHHPVNLHDSIPGLISPANAREIYQRPQISNVLNSGVDQTQRMMDISQSAVAHYFVMYQDWG